MNAEVPAILRTGNYPRFLQANLTIALKRTKDRTSRNLLREIVERRKRAS